MISSSRCSRLVFVSSVVALLSAHTSPRAHAQPQQPPRDTSAQRPAQTTPAGRISGTVLTADTGKPVKRARVFATAAELPGGRAALTDDGGVFELSDLPAGRYSIAVSKSGFITLSYGQRRPLQAGTPLQLADGQQLRGVDFRLPRGGAIAGRIVDEDGEPMPGASVRVMRYQYMQGDRRLAQAGAAQTDDKGQYRVWGLMPGDYYVTVTARGLGGPGGGGRFGGAGVFFGSGGPGPGGGRFGGGGDDQEAIAYAPTYYPGVGSVNEATAVTLGVSQEALDVSFSLQLVRTARVSGKVTNADGTPATNGMVTLAADGVGAPGSGRPQIGLSYGGRIQWDGAFTIANVPPGRYTLRARGGDDDQPQYADQPLSVAGGEVSGIVVSLARGATIVGAVTFQASQLPVPSDPSSIRVTAPPADQGQFASTAARVDKDGQFTFQGVPSGLRLIRANGAPRGWSLKTVTVNGRDTIDTPLDVRAGETIKNVSLVFTDQLTQISGTVTGDRGAPVTDYTVLAFPVDQTFWRAQSRHIMTARTDQNGSFQIRGLPPAEYYVALIDPAEQGEWFEPAFLDAHRAGATRLSLGEGETRTQDFKVSR